MTWVDAVLLVIFILLIVHGMIMGLVRGLFDMASLVLGYLLAVRLADFLPLPRAFAFLIIFILTVIIVSLAGHIITRAIRHTPLSAVNRLLGAGLGLIKAFVLGFVFLLVLHLLDRGLPVIKRSDVAPYIQSYGLRASELLPMDWSRWIKKVFEEKKPDKKGVKKTVALSQVGFW